ncbi:hypothetical protein ACHQM5_016415 [Ranunculus cassubicifolius]
MPAAKVHCPCRIVDKCTGGVGNNKGYAPSYLIRHLKVIHFGAPGGPEKYKEFLRMDRGFYEALHNALSKVGQWLCCHCFTMHATSIPCKHEDGSHVAAPIMNNGDSLIVGIQKPNTPLSQSEEDPQMLVANMTVDGDSPGFGFNLDSMLGKKVFQMGIVTVKSIPPHCRLPFTRIYKDALSDLLACSSSILRWVRLLILPICILKVVKPTDRFERRSGNRLALQQEAILKAIQIWKEHDGVYRLVKGLMVEGKGHRGIHKKGDNVKQCKRKVADGHLNAAVKVLTSGGLAPIDGKTKEILEGKHPMAENPKIPNDLPEMEPLIVSQDVVLHAIKAFPKGTSCGRDGFRAQHILDMLVGAGSIVGEELIRGMTGMVNLFLAGGCPSELAELIASAPLTPLLKPDGGVRPIAVGCVWRRLVSKVAMKVVGKQMVRYLEKRQFGVGIPGGGEAIIHAANRLMEARGGDGTRSMLLIDFQNAFNLVDRTAMLREVRLQCPSISRWVEFCYRQPSCLFFGNDVLWSSQGVQQGDPLGPLLFSLVLQPLAIRIQEECVLDMQCWYLDDGTMVGDTIEVAKAYNLISTLGPEIGLHLNVSKTELYWPTVDNRITQLKLFPEGIGRPANGVKLLGGGVSIDPEFLNELINKRAKKSQELLEAVAKLEDPQCELILLRACVGVSKLYFALRTCSPLGFQDAEDVFDTALNRALVQIVTGGSKGLGELQFRLATLPIRHGGLGALAVEDIKKFAYLASFNQSRALQQVILGDVEVGLGKSYFDAVECYTKAVPRWDGDVTLENTESVPNKLMKHMADAYYSEVASTVPREYKLNLRQRAVWDCLRVPHAQDFLYTLPIAGLGQTMNPRDYRAVLSYRLMIPLFMDDQLCQGCNKIQMDCFGDHAVHCKWDPGIKFRHDMVRDGLQDILRRAGISSKKEADVSLASEEDVLLRPADILIHNWLSGKHTCVDLTGSSPLVGLGQGIFEVHKALENATRKKYAKHDKACQEGGYEFIPFGFTTFGGLSEEAIDLLSRVEKVAHQHLVCYKSTKFVFHRLGFLIQKGIAAQIVSRLPINFVV